MLKCAYLFMISTACSLMYPPSMSPGVSIMFKVNPTLVREHIVGLRPSDCTSQHPTTQPHISYSSKSPNQKLEQGEEKPGKR